MALLTALFATALLMALGVSILLIGSTETALASRDRDSRALGFAARAAASVAAADLRAMPSWAAVAAAGGTAEVSATPGQLIDSTLTPTAPWGGAILDLQALTVRLQADSDATSPSGPAPPWRLFVYGPLGRLVPDSAPASPYYLVVWIADLGGALLIRAVAYGPGDGRSISESSLVREAASHRVRILTIRPGS
jgi:hypothetical protein